MIRKIKLIDIDGDAILSRGELKRVPYYPKLLFEGTTGQVSVRCSGELHSLALFLPTPPEGFEYEVVLDGSSVYCLILRRS